MLVIKNEGVGSSSACPHSRVEGWETQVISELGFESMRHLVERHNNEPAEASCSQCEGLKEFTLGGKPKKKKKIPWPRLEGAVPVK